MTATMAAGLATSCEEKGNTEPEEEPVTIRKTWLVFDEENGYYIGHDFGAINGKYRNLTKDSVTFYEDDASIVYKARTPEGWGLTVNNYVGLTPAIQ